MENAGVDSALSAEHRARLRAAGEIFVVAFWRDDSKFPNVAERPLEDRMRVYWRCICTLALSLRRYHSPQSLFVVATNDTPPADIAGILEAAGVVIAFVPFQTATAETEVFKAAWYLIDVILAFSTALSDDQVVVFIDPDCLVTAPLDAMIAAVRQAGRLFYEVHHPAAHVVNGLSRDDLRRISNEVFASGRSDLPVWAGGEVLGFSGRALGPFAGEIRGTRAVLAQAPDPCQTEEQFLSLVFHHSDRPFRRANWDHVIRAWTAGTYRNYGPDVMTIPIWHLPAEKERGFVRAFDFLCEREAKPVQEGERAHLARLMGLSGPSARELFFIARSAAANLGRCLRGRVGTYRST